MGPFQGIVDKFNQAMNPVRPSQPGIGPAVTNTPAKNLRPVRGAGTPKPISQTVPGATATQTVLNRPNPGGIKAPVIQQSLKGKLLTGASRMSGAVLPIQIGATVGQAYAEMDRAPAVSGRGAGRRTFNPVKNTPVADTNTNAELKPQFADIRGSITPGSMTPAPTNKGEAEAMATAEAHRKGAGYPAGVPKPADYAGVEGVGGDTPAMAAKPPIPNMTYETYMRDIGTPQGINLRNPFESTNLPGTKKAEGEVPLPEEGGTPAAGQVNNEIKANEDDSRAVNLDPSESVTESEGKASRRRASRSFLDGKMGSMQALRAAEGEMGLVSQGGRKFLRDPNAEGGLREITRDQYRARMDGGDIQAIFGENPTGAGPVAEISAKPTGYDANVSLQSGVKAESDAYIPPSDSQDPIVAGSDNTPIDSETQLQLKANEASGFAQSRLRKSFG